MDKKPEHRELRRVFSPMGWALVIYLLLMNALVTITAFVDMLLIYFSVPDGGGHTQEELNAILMGNGWGYLLTVGAGLLVLLLWKGKDYFPDTLGKRGRPMTFGDFLALTAIFMAGQLAFSVLTGLLEGFLNLFGLTAMESIEAATMSADTLSMFLYACLAAPVAEELLFRGLVLRTLEPYGKRFAILGSAFAFAVFHGNLVQIPYTFLVGLVLGYVTVEHNIFWAMLLHMMNNLILGDMIGRLTVGLAPGAENVILVAIIFLCALAALVILLLRWKEIRTYRRENPMGKTELVCFFTAPGTVALMIAAVITVVIPLVEQALE